MIKKGSILFSIEDGLHITKGKKYIALNDAKDHFNLAGQEPIVNIINDQHYSQGYFTKRFTTKMPNMTLSKYLTNGN